MARVLQIKHYGGFMVKLSLYCFFIFLLSVSFGCNTSFEPLDGSSGLSSQTNTNETEENVDPLPDKPAPDTPKADEPLSSLDAFKESLFPVVRLNCGGCHSNTNPRFAVADEQNSHDTILNGNLVNLANAANSRLVREVQGGHMGINVAVADDLIAAIEKWITLMEAP
jgi:hypothetical protein